MPFILHIDTAVTTASVCLSGGPSLLERINPQQSDHAAWLHPAIEGLLSEAGLPLSALSAIAVSSGPGSYTGLRVGMSAAKGLCFAAKLPLITIDTLKLMAAAAELETAALLCPMIDARRMEVFTAMYTQELETRMAPANLILDESSFQVELEQGPICFFGNGSDKFRNLVRHPNALFRDIAATAKNMVQLSEERYNKGEFADLAYTEPFYGKEFHSTVPQSL